MVKSYTVAEAEAILAAAKKAEKTTEKERIIGSFKVGEWVECPYSYYKCLKLASIKIKDYNTETKLVKMQFTNQKDLDLYKKVYPLLKGNA